jgi:hypothetical protein
MTTMMHRSSRDSGACSRRTSFPSKGVDSCGCNSRAPRSAKFAKVPLKLVSQ